MITGALVRDLTRLDSQVGYDPAFLADSKVSTLPAAL